MLNLSLNALKRVNLAIPDGWVSFSGNNKHPAVSTDIKTNVMLNPPELDSAQVKVRGNFIHKQSLHGCQENTRINVHIGIQIWLQVFTFASKSKSQIIQPF